jgi:hypothetical protein
VRPGDLVMYISRASRDTGKPPMLGIIIRQTRFERWFCEILLSNGRVIKNCHYVNLESVI